MSANAASKAAVDSGRGQAIITHGASPSIVHALQTSYLSSLPSQKAHWARRKGAKFNIMLVGEQGVGKATFARTVLGPHFSSSKLHHLTHRANVPAESMLQAAFTGVEIQCFEFVEHGFETHLSVVTGPGFGDYANNSESWAPFINYIDAQNERYMCQQEQPDRSREIDDRVHLCLYFLPPTRRLTSLDLEAMRKLGQRVNLVPLLAKADSYTPEELRLSKLHVRAAIAEHSICVWLPNLSRTSLDPRETKLTSEAGRSLPDSGVSRGGDESNADGYNWPLAIVCSDQEMTRPDGSTIKARIYEWGHVDVFDAQCSDLSVLTRLLFREHMLDLIDTTNDEFYVALRRDSRLLRLRLALSATDDSPSPASEHTAPPAAPTRASVMSYRPEASTAVRDAAAQQAGLITTLDRHLAISKLGYTFLKNERQDNDALLKVRAKALTTVFSAAARYEEDKLQAKSTELGEQKERLEQEIQQLELANVALKAELDAMESGDAVSVRS